MDLKDIMDLGILIEPEALDKLKKLNQDEIERLIRKIQVQRPLVLSEEIMRKYLKITYFKVLRAFFKTQRFAIQDFVNILNKRYSFLQQILIKKMELENLVSINKCSPGKVSVIGLVKTKEEKDENLVVELEDPTGSIQSVIPKNLTEKLSLDDVVAVSGNVNNKILFADSLIYPDVPLRNPVFSNQKTRIGFITDQNFEKAHDFDLDYLILADCSNIERLSILPLEKIFVVSNEIKEKDKFQYITNPCFLEIDSVIILIIYGADALDILRKRYIHKDNTDFLLDLIPDVVFSNKIINYKGISIVSNLSQINLQNREVKAIELI